MRRAVNHVTKLCNATNTRITSVNKLSAARGLISEQTTDHSAKSLQLVEKTRQRYWYRQKQEQPSQTIQLPLVGASALASLCFFKRNKERYNFMADLTCKIMPAMVHIECKNSSLGTSVTGSGFIISKRGFIITNDSVIQGARQINIHLCDGKIYSARVRHQDTTDDLALLQLIDPPTDCDLYALELSDGDKLRVGEEVLNISQTNGSKQLTVSKGMISCGLRELDDRILETSQAPSFNSGGTLLDLDGDVVGMIITSMNKANMVVPSWVIKQFITDLTDRVCGCHNSGEEKPERLIPPFTGLSLAPLADLRYIVNVEDDCDGLRVQRVIKNSPADKAGLRVGDVITKVGGKKINEIEDFYSTLVDPSCTACCGDRRKLTVWRKDGFHEDVFMTVEPRHRSLYE